MSHPHGRLIRQLVSEEIRHAVAVAIDGGEIVHSGEIAAAVFGAYPNCGATPEAIADEVIGAPGRAGVPVEMERPKLDRRTSTGCAFFRCSRLD
jgi:hypothetical protein